MLTYLESPRKSATDLGRTEFDPPPFTAIIQNSRFGAPHDDRTVIIELGSGTGLIAARIAQYLREGCDLMVATDLPEVCGLLRKNLLNYSMVEVHPLSWGNHQDAPIIASTLELGTTRRLTHILCSDLVRCGHSIVAHHPRTN